MRVLRTVLISLVVIGLLAGAGALLAREMILVWGVAKVRTSLSTMRQIVHNPRQYAQECQARGGSDAYENLISRFQLRFVDDRTFVLEVICEAFKLNPIVVKEDSLPMFVTKTPGSAGIIWNQDLSGIELEVFGRKRAILVEGETVRYETGAQQLGVSPVSTCQAYGYTCCQAETGLGDGQAYSQALDCPRSCFSECVARPVVFSFAADPFLDPTTRTVQAQAGQTVTFAFVASSPTAATSEVPAANVTIQFGDGQQDTSTLLEDTFTHEYQCARPSCAYQVQLEVVDQNGVPSFAGPVTKMTVNVTGR